MYHVQWSTRGIHVLELSTICSYRGSAKECNDQMPHTTQGRAQFAVREEFIHSSTLEVKLATQNPRNSSRYSDIYAPQTCGNYSI